MVNGMGFGTISIPKTTYQAGEILMAQLTHKLWDMLSNMWYMRNKLYTEEKMISNSSEMKKVDRAIKRQRRHHLRGLPPSFTYLFKGSDRKLLKASSEIRKKWLTTIIVLREKQGYNMERQVGSFLYNWLINKQGR